MEKGSDVLLLLPSMHSCLQKSTITSLGAGLPPDISLEFRKGFYHDTQHGDLRWPDLILCPNAGQILLTSFQPCAFKISLNQGCHRQSTALHHRIVFSAHLHSSIASHMHQREAWSGLSIDLPIRCLPAQLVCEAKVGTKVHWADMSLCLHLDLAVSGQHVGCRSCSL